MFPAAVNYLPPRGQAAESRLTKCTDTGCGAFLVATHGGVHRPPFSTTPDIVMRSGEWRKEICEAAVGARVDVNVVGRQSTGSADHFAPRHSCGVSVSDPTSEITHPILPRDIHVRLARRYGDFAELFPPNLSHSAAQSKNSRHQVLTPFDLGGNLHHPSSINDAAGL